jgi:hypothetical protein
MYFVDLCFDHSLIIVLWDNSLPKAYIDMLHFLVTSKKYLWNLRFWRWRVWWWRSSRIPQRVDTGRSFKATYCLLHQNSDVGGSNLWSISPCLPQNTVQYPRRQPVFKEMFVFFSFLHGIFLYMKRTERLRTSSLPPSSFKLGTSGWVSIKFDAGIL